MKDLLVILRILFLCFELYRLLRGNWIQRFINAAHMLQAGINLVYIRDFLGHASITSTEIYAKVDSEMKRKALESAYLDLETGKLPSWDKDGDLMSWLQNLCR